MARLIQPRPEPTTAADLFEEAFKQSGFADDAPALAAICRSVGLEAVDPLDDRYEDHERVVEHVARELRKLMPGDTSIDVVLILEIHVLQQAVRQGFRNWTPDITTLTTAASFEYARGRADVSDAVQVACTIFKDGPAQLKSIIAALFSAGHIDPLRFLDANEIRTTTKGTGGSWHQTTRENDPRLPDYWFALDAVRALDALRRLFEQEPIETLGLLALGIERSIMLQYPGEPTSRANTTQEIEMRDLYPQVDPLSQVLCRRRRLEGDLKDRTLTRCCWSYGRLAAERAPEALGEDYKPLADLALAELGELRNGLRSPDAEAFLQKDSGDYLAEAVFFGPRTDPASLWGVLRRLLLALREVRHRGVPLDLRTWDEPEPSFERVPRPWNWAVDHIARVLELLLGRELERDAQLKELRREFAKFCVDRIKTREKVGKDEPRVANEAFVEPNPAWRAAYINAVKELHPNLGERGHHAIAWSRDHDPDEDVRDAARSAAEVVRHGHGLPKNTSPRRAMFAAFWWLRQAHVVSLGEQVDIEGAQRTFRKEMRRQADLEK